MPAFSDLILRSLPPSENSATRLRVSHVGAVIDHEKLRTAGFRADKPARDGSTVWQKSLQRGSRRISLEVASVGVLCNIRLARLWEVFDEPGAPCGWYIDDDLSKQTETRLDRSLAECISEPLPGSSHAEWQQLLNRLRFKPEGWQGSTDPDYVLCCHINGFRTSSPPVAAMLSLSLMRHVQQISNPGVLADLVFHCGRLNLFGECASALRLMIERGYDTTAEAWTNIGSVLCDNLHKPQVALECFRRAISMKPNLDQANANAWVAAKELMGQALNRRSEREAVAVFEDVRSTASDTAAHHGAFSFAGLAYESLGDSRQAETCYRRAIELDSNCSTANSSLRRLTSPSTAGTQLSLCDQMMVATRGLEYVAFVEDEYHPY